MFANCGQQGQFKTELRQDGQILGVNGIIYYKVSHLRIDKRRCATVNPETLPAFQVMESKETYILETTNGYTITVLRIYNTKFQIGRHLIKFSLIILLMTLDQTWLL